jgi:DNA helicase-2/ATP-dependent DNA helicase PcrA
VGAAAATGPNARPPAAEPVTGPAELVDHRGGPLLIEGPGGAGKSRLIRERFLHLVADGTPPDQLVLLVPTRARAKLARARLEQALTAGYSELVIADPAELAAAVLRRAPGRGHLADAVLSAGERLALLAERIDELPLTHHDFGGNANALLAQIVGRIDALKAQRISAERYAEWAARRDDDASLRDAARLGRLPVHGAREREFAAIYATHERILRDAGLLDCGDLLGLAIRVAQEPEGLREPFAHVLVDDAEELSLAAATLARALAGAQLTVAGDPDGGAGAFRAAAPERLASFTAPGMRRVSLTRRRPLPVRRFWAAANERAQAQAVAAEIERLINHPDAPVPSGQIAVLVPSVARDGPAVAVALEERVIPHRLVGDAAFFQRAEVRDLLAWLRLLSDPSDGSAAVRALARPPVELRSVDIARVSQIARRRKLDMVAALAAATESPQVPPEARERIRACLKLYRASVAQIDTARPDLYVHRLIDRLGLRRRNLFGAQAEVVEQLRALARFGELAAAYSRRAPQGSARDFARSVAAVADQSALSVAEPEEPVLSGSEVVQVIALEAAGGLELEYAFLLGIGAGLGAEEQPAVPDELLSEPLPAEGEATRRALLTRRLSVAAARPARGLVISYDAARGAPHPWAETARAGADAAWEPQQEELFGPAEALPSSYRLLREELLAGTTRAAGRLAELRLDTDLDVSHAVVRYLELLKVAALMARLEGDAGVGLSDALRDINDRIGQAVTADQREILATSPLDGYLLDADRDAHRRAQVLAARDEPSLARYLPTRGEGVLLSASDIDTYRACPLKYKFARVFKIPQEPTLHQRFGIAVHQVLERFHGAAEANGQLGSVPELLGLLDTAWRRQGFGASDEERQLRSKAEAALSRYHDSAGADGAQPVWFERAFSFKLGPHLVRGRVDRVDRLPGGEYELIDYKTGRPRSAEALSEDVQLSLYTVAAQEAWGLEHSRGVYLYLLDDARAAISGDPDRAAWIRAVALEVAEGIQAQEFEPTPSVAACGFCDYRLACPAAER